MGCNENIEIFLDTKKKCELSKELQESIKYTKDNTQFILESNNRENENLNKFEECASVTVSKKRSLEAAFQYKNSKTAVLNFASATNPGGGVTKGSSAQEESLCRISTLYDCINTEECLSNFYNPHRKAMNPIHNGDIIYSPDVTVFKSDTNNPKDLDQDNWYKVDIITCAAPNLRERPSNKWCPDEKGKAVKISDMELLEIHKDRLTRILDSAVDNNVDNIILGAFGCGAFRNKPEIVARAAKEVIGDYTHAFKNIEFAIYDKPGTSTTGDMNFRTFNRILSPYTKEK